VFDFFSQISDALRQIAWKRRRANPWLFLAKAILPKLCCESLRDSHRVRTKMAAMKKAMKAAMKRKGKKHAAAEEAPAKKAMKKGKAKK